VVRQVARFLFTVWPFAGHLHPAIAVGHALRARNHSVAFYTGGSVGSLVEREGFECFPFRRLDEGHISALVESFPPYSPSTWTRLRSAPQYATKFREWVLDSIPAQVDDLDEILSQWAPDVIICDPVFWSPLLIFSERREIAVVVLSILAACMLPGPDAPFWGQGLPRPRNAMMRLRSRLLLTVMQWGSAGFRAEVDRVRQRYSLPALDCSVTEFAARMPLYLVPSTREYDYQRSDLPASVHYVGPCLWDKPSSTSTPEWLKPLGVTRPLVYVTEATVGTGEPFLLKAAARALQDMPVDVVMTTGRQRDPTELGVLASNIRVEAYVPQSDLLPKAAVMVTVGGSGGVLAALQAGVPLVVAPTEWDRPENAQRVVEAGAGLRVAAERCTPKRLRAAVERVLHEPSFRRNAECLREVCTRYGGPARAAQLLEGLSDSRTECVG
jgi:MGT family glycosyltransferase